MNIRRRPERGSVWRIAPPLTVTREDIDLAMTIFDQALTEMKAVVAPRPGTSGTSARTPRAVAAPAPRGQPSTL
jgi:2,2-dialkylglycine decarboxylase (pyruvate)